MITEPAPADYGKTCTLVGYTSQITISIQSAAVLPEYFSAVINNEIKIDECMSGSPTRYTFRRHNDHNATLSLFAIPGSPVHNLFFKDDVPYDLVDLNVQVYGRDMCESDGTLVTSIQKPLKWIPVYANGEGCGLNGYSGF
jgi:hypothetical protein